ncbi:hypothetical protein GIB67_022372, partial [Kingdonia uniflora]
MKWAPAVCRRLRVVYYIFPLSTKVSKPGGEVFAEKTVWSWNQSGLTVCGPGGYRVINVLKPISMGYCGGILYLLPSAIGFCSFSILLTFRWILCRTRVTRKGWGSLAIV